MLAALVCAGPGVAAPAGAPAAATPLSPLERGQRCYAEGLLGCVIEQLAGVTPTAEQAAEHLRLLAFAYARLDRTAEARAVFARWIALSRNHRLAAGAVPQNVWAAYSAALLDSVRGSLDLQSKAGADAVPLPPAATAGTLPHIPPPPRSERDRGNDVEVELGLLGGLQPGGAPVVGVAGHLGLLLGGGAGQVGLALRGARLIGEPTPDLASGGGLFAGFGLRGALRPLGIDSALEVAADLGGGVLQRDGAASQVRAAIGAAIRYAPPPRAGVGLSVALAPTVWMGGDAPEIFVSASIGVVLRPGSGAKE
ncbi:MAG: hypothetical protein RIT45_1912 [Pseudomonadota bacterium]